MTRALFILALSFAAAAVTPALAAAPEPSLKTTAAPQDASWLVGRWVGAGIDQSADKVFDKPAEDGAMVEYFRQGRINGAPVIYEVILLRDGGAPLGLEVKHVAPGILGRGDSAHPGDINFIASGEDELRLNDMLFKRIGNNELEVIIAPRDEVGLNRGETLRYTRAPN